MLKIEPANIRWQANNRPYSKRFKEYYIQNENDSFETKKSFIKANALEQRFLNVFELKSTQGGHFASQKGNQKTDFCIAETGFGTATNFLITAKEWLKSSSTQDYLRYISFEKYPLSKEELLTVHGESPFYQTILTELITHYPFLLPGWHDLYLFGGRIRLTLWFGDVLQGLPMFDCSVDAWFLDGFTPDNNPEMWQAELYSQMARLSHLETTFSASAAINEVKKGLEQVGFAVNSDENNEYSSKMCFGCFVRPRKFSPNKPWFNSPPKIKNTHQEIYIIGAGLAGSAVAYHMAILGWKVTVLEAERTVSTQASGNLAGAIHPLVTADWNIRSQFYLQGYETTLRWLENWHEQNEIVGDLTGLMQLAVDEKIEKRLQDSLKRVGLPQDFAVWCNPAQASERIGTETHYSGLFFPKAGWVNPKSIVEKCLAHPNISVKLGQTVTQIEQLPNQQWHITVQTTSQTTQFETPVLVVATAGLDAKLNQALSLEIRPVKGQVSHLKQTAQTLQTTLTHQGYSIDNVLIDGTNYSVSGATFEAPDLSAEISTNAHQYNFEMANTAIPNWLNADIDSSKPTGKVGFRPASADHLPIIGAVVDADKAIENYYSQSHTHAVFRYQKQSYQTGLYLSNGHGARGLMSVFLAAEMIASQILGTEKVLAENISHACHPERFRVRRWRSGKAN